ncbi:MAG TPA: M20/M25/M40 family metallo-hydrolase, partial [Bryobacteraceae bacterium]|nr:M20/M25/M40 family metallo-hydrolase [Bryobacteraceae bacterium]
LRAGVALVSDTSMYADDMPSLCLGLRGLVYMEVDAVGPSRDLHSGNYGGAAPNAVFALVELLSKAKNRQGVIQIPGIYDDVEPPEPSEKESWGRLPFNEREFRKKEVGAKALTGDRRFTVLERIWARPTFEVHGIAGGFTGAGAKTVIPSKATAKVSIRLVPKQEPDRIIAAFREFVRKRTPKGIRTDVRVLSSAPAVVVNPSHPAIDTAAKAFGEVFGKPTVFIRSGGSVPIVGEFARHLGIPSVLMGFGLPDDGLHGPNEKFRLENYYRGIRTVAAFFERFGQ